MTKNLTRDAMVVSWMMPSNSLLGTVELIVKKIILTWLGMGHVIRIGFV